MPHPVTFRAATTPAGGDNAATPGVDVRPIDLEVELPAGETTVTFEVPLIGDDLDEEPDEVLHLGISEPSHGMVVGGSKVPRIMDDDGAMVLRPRPGGFEAPTASPLGRSWPTRSGSAATATSRRRGRPGRRP